MWAEEAMPTNEIIRTDIHFQLAKNGDYIRHPNGKPRCFYDLEKISETVKGNGYELFRVTNIEKTERIL